MSQKIYIEVFFLVLKKIVLISFRWEAMHWNQVLAASKNQLLTFYEFCNQIVKIYLLVQIKLYKLIIN